MKSWLRIHAESNPGAVALIAGNRHLTYGQLYDKALRLAGSLSKKGIKPGMHVALAGNNSDQYVLLLHALILLGAVVVPVNIRLTAEDIENQISFADCEHILIDDDMQFTILTQNISQHKFSEITPDSSDTSGISFERLQSDTLLLMFTSGTSGSPKCVELTYANIFYNALGTKLRLQFTEDDSWLLSLPLYHIGGFSIVLRTCIYGIPLLIPEGLESKDIKAAIDEQDPAFISLVPTMMKRLLENNVKPNNLHKAILLGGGPIPGGLVDACEKYGWKIATTYGTTETGSQIATRHPDAVAQKESAGQPLPFTSIRIIDKQGDEVSAGTEGEIIVATPSCMKGYYKQDDLTAEVIHDGWYHTGDYGYVTEDSYLYVVSRRSDIIVSGGENINPVEVEYVLRDHSGIQDVCVIPYSDPEWGEVPVAVIVPVDEAVSLESIKQFLTGKIASFKIPKKIFYFEEIPYTQTGKIQRELIRKQITGANKLF